jgi:signal transduction histidine kinase
MSLLGLSEGLADKIFTDEKAEEVVDILVENAKHMTSIVQSFRSTIPEESAYRTVELSTGDLMLLVNAACSPAWVEDTGPLHTDRVTIAVLSQGTVAVDPMRLRRIITNLVENALRHTSGDVEVCVEKRDLALMVEVCDRGAGLSPTARQGRGRSGLGVSIVQNLVYAMRGSVEWLPREGGGTRVRVEIPFSGQHQ